MQSLVVAGSSIKCGKRPDAALAVREGTGCLRDPAPSRDRVLDGPTFRISHGPGMGGGPSHDPGPYQGPSEHNPALDR